MSAKPLDQWAREEITRLKEEKQELEQKLHASFLREALMADRLDQETKLVDEQLATIIKYKNKYGNLPGDK